jgi:hypothetical protein
MRLLNVDTGEMHDFISQGDLPPYAILSHTWEDEEISFQQWEARKTAESSQMKGYKKIQRFCDVAREAGYEWVWVDT